MSDKMIQQTMMGHGFSDQMNKSMEQNRNALRRTEKRSWFTKSKVGEKNALVEAGKKMNKSEFMAFSAHLKHEQRLQRARMAIIFTLIFVVLGSLAVGVFKSCSATWSETHDGSPHFHNNDRPNAYE